MAQVITDPYEDDVDSSFAGSGDVNQPLVDDVPVPPQESTGNLTVPNPSVGAGEPTETLPSATSVSERKLPKEALKEVQAETHYLFCSVCKSNITNDTMLVEKDSDSQYNTKNNYVSWVLRFNLPRFYSREPKPVPPLFTELTLSSPRFILGVVVLLLSVTVMWFHDSPLPPPGPLLTLLGPYIKTGWLIHFQSINYFSMFSLFCLAVLALLWTYISPSISRPEGSRRYAWLPQALTKLKEFLTTVKSVLYIDILKSVVYGGLVESIMSLGVVASAAASGASTLNVLALGLANLFSGLFLIIHRLHELIKYDKDEYKKWLGETSKYQLHRVVVVVSLIFFGVIPPLFYGLSFKLTDKGHYYKAAVVLAASLVCVISLSFAKAYIFAKDRLIRTVAEYTGIAIGASALSFIASQHVSDLLEKYGFHELASDYRKA